MFKKIVLTAGVASALTVTPVLAQQGQTGQATGGQGLTQDRSVQGARIYLSPTTIRQIQQALNAQGYNTGSLNGQWNTITASAAQQFQLSEGLEPTGTPTLAFINALGVDEQIMGQMGRQGEGGQGRQQSGQRMGEQPQQSAQGSGVPLYIGSSSIRQVEQALNQQGYAIDQVDGIWDAGASRAAERFQRDNNLEPTGQLDVNLISALGLEQEVFSAGKGGQGDERWSQNFVVSQGTPLWVSPATIRQVEKALNRNGYDVGSIEGNWNDQVVQAVENYQQTRGFEPTGNLTVEVLGSLGIQNFMTGGGSQLGRAVGQQQGQQMSQAGGVQGQPASQAGGEQGGQGQQMSQAEGGQGRQGQQMGQAGAEQGGQAQQLTQQDFQRLDQNGDRQLSQEELSQYGRAAAGSEQLMQRYDRDGDGAVSRQELQLQLQGQPDAMDVQEMEIGQTPEREPQQLTRQDFIRLDQNQDGRLTEDELSEYGRPAAGGDQLLQRYDQDGDGVVSRQELQQAQQSRQQSGQQQQGQQQQGQQQQNQQAPIPAVPPVGEQADQESGQ